MSLNVFNKLCSFRTLRAYNSLNSAKKLDLSINKRLISRINESQSNNSQTEQQTVDSSEVNREVNDQQSDKTSILLDEIKMLREKYEQSSSETKKLRKENEQLIEDKLNEKKEMDDKYKRCLADLENMRIRKNKQIEDVKQFAVQNWVENWLDIIDALQKSNSSVPKDVCKLDSNQVLQIFKNLIAGNQTLELQILTVFRRYGVTQINPLIGQKFDPNEHHALKPVIDNSIEPGSVAFVHQIGYKLHNRTIRAAKVDVVKASDT